MQAIGRILLEQWDPIGVAAVPAAYDEYDAYVGGVYQLLASGANVPAVADHLEAIERGMGVRTDRARAEAVAAAMRALDIAQLPDSSSEDAGLRRTECH